MSVSDVHSITHDSIFTLNNNTQTE